MRICTGSALCAALVLNSATTATLANINFGRRMGFLLLADFAAFGRY
jgi:hypothetical protein